jgi:hypothetical protein
VGPAEVSHFDGWSVQYVRAVRKDGSGTVVPLRGGATLQVTVGARGYDGHGYPTYSPARPLEAIDVSGFTTLRQVAWLGSSEGRSGIGIGIGITGAAAVPGLPDRGELGPRDRLVIDVAHRW